MKQSQAVQFLRVMLAATQKARSNANDPYGGLIDGEEITEEVLGHFQPYVFGEKNIVPSLVKCLENVETGKKVLEPQEFFNFMFLAEKSGLIQGAAILSQSTSLPAPDIRWLRGWESEEP